MTITVPVILRANLGQPMSIPQGDLNLTNLVGGILAVSEITDEINGALNDLIEAAGETPNPSDPTQLRTALDTIYGVGIVPTLLAFIPPAEHEAIIEGSSTYDCRADAQGAIDGLGVLGGDFRIERGTHQFSASDGTVLLVTNPVNIVGDGGVYSAINPAQATTSDVTLQIDPTTGYDHTLQSIRNVALHDPDTGLRTGAQGILLNTLTTGQLLTKFVIDGVIVGQGTGLAFDHENDTGLNPSGGLVGALITNSMFKGGLRFSGSGDSNSVVRNVSSGTGLGVYVSLTPGSSCFELLANNITNANGVVCIDSGSRFRLAGNNTEHSTVGAAANNNAAAWNLRGANGVLENGVVIENLISVFGSSDASTSLTMSNCRGVEVKNNTFLGGLSKAMGNFVVGKTYIINAVGSATGGQWVAVGAASATVGITFTCSAAGASVPDALASTLLSAITIGSDCFDTRVGPNGYNAGVTVQVVDNGVGTMGVVKTGTLTGGPWLPFDAGTHSSTFVKYTTGQVQFLGSIKSGTDTNGTVFLVLPVGFRPDLTVRQFIGYISAGVPAMCEITIDIDGNCALNYVTANTQVNFNVTFPAANLANSVSLE